MNAIITTTSENIQGKTIQEIRSILCGMLKVDGPQGLTAKTDTGVTIHVELFEGNDYILPASAALGSIRSDRKAAASRTNGKRGGRPRKTA